MLLIYIAARVSNSSTFRGWLEITGLDDILVTTCDCIFGPDELPPAAQAGGGAGAGHVQTAQPARTKK